MTTRAIQIATFLSEWLHWLAAERNMSIMALAAELRTPRQLLEEVGRTIAQRGIEDGRYAFQQEQKPAAPDADTSLRARVAYHTYQRLFEAEMERANAEADAQLRQELREDA